MGISLPHVLISIIVIVIVVVLIFLTGNRGENRLTPLAGLAFGLIMAGILFSQNRFFAYAMMGIGILIAVLDIIVRGKRK